MPGVIVTVAARLWRLAEPLSVSWFLTSHSLLSDSYPLYVGPGQQDSMRKEIYLISIFGLHLYKTSIEITRFEHLLHTATGPQREFLF